MRIAVNREDDTATMGTLFVRTFLPFAIVFTLLTALTTRMLYEGELNLLRQNETATLERSLLSLQKNLETPQGHLLSLQQEQPIRTSLRNPDDNLQSMANSFSSLISRNPHYVQVRWIDQQGQERLRIEPQPDNSFVHVRTPNDKLQNKQQRYYFQDTLALGDPQHLYISPMDLNVEHGEIEYPLRPTLRMAVQLWDQETPQGIIVININARDYLHDLEQPTEQEASRIQLISPDGYWLKHPNPSLEWGVQLPHGRSFKKQQPTIWQLMQSYSEHQLLNDAGLWSWTTLYPDSDPTRFNNKAVGVLLSHLPTSRLSSLRLKYWGGALLVLGLILTLGGFTLYRILKAQRAQQIAENQAISNRAQADQLKKQREDEQRFRVIFNASHTPLLVCNSSGNITLVNPALEKLFGYSAFELTGLPVEHLVPVEQRKHHAQDRQNYLGHLRPRRKMMNNGQSLKGLRKDGQTVDVEIGLSPYESEGKTFILATLEDISARIQSENALKEIHQRQTKHLEQARADAERLAHLKSNFLANMSHEIRTPLNAVMVLSELLSHESLPDNARVLSDNINSAGQNLLHIVNDVLDFSKIEDGGFSLEQTAFSLKSVLTQLLSITEVSAEQKGLKLHLNTGGAERLMLMGDPHRLKQVLLNLVSNGIKFTEQGKVSIQIRKLEQNAEQIRLRFSVSDTGIGIPEAQQSAIFSPFAQADNSITRKFGGTGLGLAISRQLIELMGGELSINSTPGQGSTFSFSLTLPVASAEQQVRSKSQDASPVPAQLLRGRTLLVVDDSELNRDIARRVIERAGGSALLACHGQEALDIVHQSNRPIIDLILMDLQMPVMDGYEAMRQLQQITGATIPPIVALTAGITTETKQEALKAGAIQVLTKPFTLSQIMACFNKLLPYNATGEVNAAVASHTLLTESAVLDESTALINWGDKQSLLQFLQQFAEQYGDCDQQIDAFLAAGQHDSAEKLAHKVKGAAASLYLNALQSELGQLEQALKNNHRIDNIKSLSQTLAKTLDTITSYRRECKT